jgi:DNA-binding SARP family transcriptional activator
VYVEYRVLGPLEALVDGRPAKLGGPKQRATLALLLMQANTVVPATRLVDGLWIEDPPASAANLVQGYISGLRKALGKSALETRGAGYVLRVGGAALDLHRFERLLQEGSRALEARRYGEASGALQEALGLWQGSALADLEDEPALDTTVSRLEELRVLALERLIDARLALGQHAELVAEIEQLVAHHPLRERSRGQLMIALYRSGRQAEALETYRVARATLVEEVGIEPSEWLADLHSGILRHDPALAMHADLPTAAGSSLRAILVSVSSPEVTDALVSLVAPLARDPRRELLLVTTVASADALGGAATTLNAHREHLLAGGVDARSAAFTSVVPGGDVARLARDHDVDLLVVDAPERLLEDARILAVLDQAPCDVAVVVEGKPKDGPVVVLFAGTEHDWAAVELGGWLARNGELEMRLVGATSPDGRDASMLLANVSIAVQRTLGVAAEPRLVKPEPSALVAAAADSSVVVLGLTARWRRDGLGRARTAVAVDTAAPTVLVRRGVRPGGLAPSGSETRFTWTIAG